MRIDSDRFNLLINIANLWKSVGRLFFWLSMLSFPVNKRSILSILWLKNIKIIKIGEDRLIDSFSVVFSPSSLAWTNKQGFVTDVKLKKHLQILICFNDIDLWICMSLRGTQGYSLGTNNRKHYRKSNNVTWFMCQFLSRCLALFNKVKHGTCMGQDCRKWLSLSCNSALFNLQFVCTIIMLIQ